MQATGAPIMIETLGFALVTLALVAFCLALPKANLLTARGRKRAVGKAPLGSDRNNARRSAIVAALCAAVPRSAIAEIAAPRGLAREGRFRTAGGGAGRFTILSEAQTEQSYVVELEASEEEDGPQQHAA